MFQPDDAVQITARQQDVLRLIALGRTNAKIAEALTLAPGTLANYVEVLLHRAEQLVLLGFATQWVSLLVRAHAALADESATQGTRIDGTETG